jgi:hypothetical protein
MGVGHGSCRCAIRGCPALLRSIRGDPCPSVACDSGAPVPLPPWLPLRCIPWLPCVTAIYPCRSVSIRGLRFSRPGAPAAANSRCLAFRGCPAILRFIRDDRCQSVACDSGAPVPLPPRIPFRCNPWLPCVIAIYPCRSVSIRGLRFRRPGAPAAVDPVALNSVAALRYWDLSVSIRVHPCPSVACDSDTPVPLPPWIPLPCIPWLPCDIAIYSCRSVSIRGLRFSRPVSLAPWMSLRVNPWLPIQTPTLSLH